MNVTRAWPDKRAEPFVLSLNFLLHFLLQGKKWKKNYSRGSASADLSLRSKYRPGVLPSSIFFDNKHSKAFAAGV
jgi:hypothetical protein